MTLGGTVDWQKQVAPTATLLGVVSRANAAAFSIPISASLLPQHTAIAVSIVFKPGTACVAVGWNVQDVTINAAITLNTVFDSSNPGMQVRPFTGQYLVQNPGNDLEVEFAPIGGANLVADVYVFGITQYVGVLPQVGLNGFSDINTITPVTVAAATTTTVLAAPAAGYINRLLWLGANHVTAAAAVARVSWLRGIGGNPIATTLDTAVANFVWNNVVQLDTTLDLQYANGSSQPHQVIVAYQVGPR